MKECRPFSHTSLCFCRILLCVREEIQSYNDSLLPILTIVFHWKQTENLESPWKYKWEALCPRILFLGNRSVCLLVINIFIVGYLFSLKPTTFYNWIHECFYSVCSWIFLSLCFQKYCHTDLLLWLVNYRSYLKNYNRTPTWSSYTEISKSAYHRHSCISTITAALFIAAKLQNQHWYPTTGK